MQCLRSNVPGVSASLINSARAKPVNAVRSMGGGGMWKAHQPFVPTGDSGVPSLHGDLPKPAFRDDHRRDNWRNQTNPAERHATNNLSTYMMVGAGGGAALYMAKYTLYGLALMLGPGRDKYAAAAIEVDLATIPEGKNAVFTWRGKPLFIRHRTADEIASAQSTDIATLRDPQADTERCVNEKYLICLGVCTHLGCVPIAHAGDYKGYYCPCHGSHYDTCARIMKGPAPLNLEVPKHDFLTDTLVIIGKED